jgi:DNA-binding response OmpR family regulator
MTLPWHITCTCFSRHALLIRDPVHRANVVNVYINYFRRQLDSGYDRALIRTIRGVGYQIGGNGQHT